MNHGRQRRRIGDLLGSGGGGGGPQGFGGDSGGFPGGGAFPGDTGGFPGGDPSQPGFTPSSDTGMGGGPFGGAPFGSGSSPGGSSDPAATAPQAMTQGAQGDSSPGAGTQSNPPGQAQRSAPQQAQTPPGDSHFESELQKIANLLLGRGADQEAGLGQFAEANTGTMSDAGPIMIPPQLGTSGPPNVVTGPPAGGEARPPMGGGPMAGTGAMPQPQPPGQGGGQQAGTGDLPQPDTSAPADIPLPKPRPAEAGPGSTTPSPTTTAEPDPTSAPAVAPQGGQRGGQQPFNPLQNFAQAIAKFLHGDIAGGIGSLLGLSQQAGQQGIPEGKPGDPWYGKPIDPRYKGPGSERSPTAPTSPVAPVSPQSQPAPGQNKDINEPGISEAEKQQRIRARDLGQPGTYVQDKNGKQVLTQTKPGPDGKPVPVFDANGEPVPVSAATEAPAGANAPGVGANPARDRWVSAQHVNNYKNGGSDTRPTPGYSNVMRQARAKAASGLTDRDRLELAGMAAKENSADPIGPIESIFNRSAATGQPIHTLLHNGFYRNTAPYFNSAGQMAKRSPALWSRYQSAVDAAVNGSNVLAGATDQGSAKLNDPNAGNRSGRIFRSNEVYNDHGGSGGRVASGAWRREIQGRVQQELRGGAPSATLGPRSEGTLPTQFASGGVSDTPMQMAAGKGDIGAFTPRGPGLPDLRTITSEPRAAAPPGQPAGPTGEGSFMPMEENSGLYRRDQLPPGADAGPTGAGAGFPPAEGRRGLVQPPPFALHDPPYNPGGEGRTPEFAPPKEEAPPPRGAKASGTPRADAGPTDDIGKLPKKKAEGDADTKPKKKTKPKGMDPKMKKRITARQREVDPTWYPGVPTGMGRMWTP